MQKNPLALFVHWCACRARVWRVGVWVGVSKESIYLYLSHYSPFLGGAGRGVPGFSTPLTYSAATAKEVPYTRKNQPLFSPQFLRPNPPGPFPLAQSPRPNPPGPIPSAQFPPHPQARPAQSSHPHYTQVYTQQPSYSMQEIDLICGPGLGHRFPASPHAWMVPLVQHRHQHRHQHQLMPRMLVEMYMYMCNRLFFFFFSCRRFLFFKTPFCRPGIVQLKHVLPRKENKDGGDDGE